MCDIIRIRFMHETLTRLFYWRAYLNISELVAAETLPLGWGRRRLSNGLKSHWIGRFQRDLKEFHPVLMTATGPSPWGLADHRALESGPKAPLLLMLPGDANSRVKQELRSTTIRPSRWPFHFPGTFVVIGTRKI